MNNKDVKIGFILLGILGLLVAAKAIYDHSKKPKPSIEVGKLNVENFADDWKHYTLGDNYTLKTVILLLSNFGQSSLNMETFKKLNPDYNVLTNPTRYLYIFGYPIVTVNIKHLTLNITS